MELLSRSDFAGIGDIANHCDLGKLNIAINEASLFDMEDIFCDFWKEALDNWDSTDENWNGLINGGSYSGCNGSRTHGGLKEVLKYYAYSRYIILNGFNDTPSGMVAKTNSFSMPTPLKELQAYSDKYRNMAKSLLKRTNSYLCVNRSYFASFNDYDCKSCGCGGCEKSGINTKGFGFKSSVISKKL